ncbi:HSP20-like chaperone protein [Actinidia chinensis var. chinensis]|uniref:Co-chaperone protein p23 n=1 Tax=Actinidia chinensis var. chinensis TaxID=1590841 RepID=A0A2R6Q0U0_ACTCC|nr:HSP20-like chaperone protein [Actinidia chinensis var. chinensis]
MSRHPTVKWAQRSDKLSITIELPDAKDVKLKLEPEGKFFFSATSGVDNVPYELDMDLYDKVDVNESKASVGLRNICYLIKKAESKSWSRLLKQEGKPPVFLKVDWDKWVDEDEGQDSKSGAGMDFGDFDFSKLNMGGGGDFDGDEDEAEKDEGNDEGTMEEDDMVEVSGKKNIEEAAPASGEH